MTDREEYREALVEAFRVVAAKMVTRSDASLKTLLGSVVSRGGVTEVVEAVGVDYGNALRRLDDLARTNLMEVVKGLVKEDPVLVIVDDSHDHKLYSRTMPVGRNGTQVFHCGTRRFEPSIQLLVIAVRDLVRNEVYVVTWNPTCPGRPWTCSGRGARRSSEPGSRWYRPWCPCSGTTSTCLGGLRLVERELQDPVPQDRRGTQGRSAGPRGRETRARR